MTLSIASNSAVPSLSSISASQPWAARTAPQDQYLDGVPKRSMRTRRREKKPCGAQGSE